MYYHNSDSLITFQSSTPKYVLQYKHAQDSWTCIDWLINNVEYLKIDKFIFVRG